MNYLKVALMLFCLMGLAAHSVVAADSSVNAGVLQKHTEDLQEHYRLKKMLKDEAQPQEKPQIDDETDADPKPKKVDQTRILIRSVVTDESEILSEEDIAGVTSAYVGNRTIGDLFEMVDKLNELYRRKGFITAKAILPPQKVEGGVVRIRLIEGRVGKVLVEGNRHTRDSFILNKFSLNQGELVQLETLEQELIYFNAVSDVRMRAALRPGAELGETDLVLKAEEPRNYEISLLTDNAGTETVGEERLGLKLVDRSLFGFRDALMVSGYLSEGTETLSTDYSIPINLYGTRFSVGYGLNNVEIQSGPFADLDVGGDSFSYNVNLNHPIIINPTTSANLFAGYQFNKSNTDFSGVTITETKVNTIPFGFDFKRYDSYGLLYLRNTLTSVGVWGDNQKRFFLYNLDLVRTFSLGEESFVLLRGNGQLSSRHPLVSTEQFQVGGLSSVRGYPEGFLVGDEGYFVSAEAKFPLFKDTDSILHDKFNGSVFIDHGAAFPYRGEGQSSHSDDFITGVGVGLSIHLSKYLSGRIDLGVPLAKHGQDIDSVRVHFSLQSLLF